MTLLPLVCFYTLGTVIPPRDISSDGNPSGNAEISLGGNNS